MEISKLLTKGLTKEETAELTLRFVNSEDVLEAVSKVLSDKIEESSRKLLKPSYDLPAWSENQADLVGYTRALDEIKKLIQLRK